MTDLRAALREEDGFTLVETIVAFVLLALVISAAVEIIGQGSFRQRFDQGRMTALSHAQSELAALGATGTVSVGTTEGRYADGNSWRLLVAPLHAVADVAPSSSTIEEGATPAVGPEAGALIPYAVSVEIFAGDASEASVALTTVVIGRAAE